MKFKSYDQFKEAVIQHLGSYNQGPDGVFKTKKYKHILHIPSDSTQKEVIENILQKDRVEIDLFEKPQLYAHHLNSSQIVCYEFFRPLLNKDRSVKAMLKHFLTDNHIENEGLALTGRFEYIPNQEEYTNFDFYLEEGSLRIYFEIKYTERGFSGCEKDKSHQDKFDSVYKSMIEKCGCIGHVPSFDEFCKYYQLFRNVLRVTKENGEQEYAVFLFPKENSIVEKHFVEFKKKYVSGALSNHVICIHWEDCTRYMSDMFRKKFFFYIG